MFHIEKYQLNEATRNRLGGSYVSLPEGVTYYAIDGPENPNPVVLVHGGTIPLFTWDECFPLLTTAGLRVVRYDMYGRGYSNRPNVTYDRRLYCKQLLDLIGALKLHQPVDLVGFSLGGATVVNFTAQYPERVRRLALISPLVHDYSRPGVLQPRIVGEIFMRTLGIRMVIKRANALFERTRLSKQHAALFAEQIAYRGFQNSLLSLFRSDALGDYRDTYSAVGKQNRRVLLIWGTSDTEITGEMIGTVQRLIPHAEFHTIQGIGHGIVFQRPEEVSALLISFLKNI